MRKTKRIIALSMAGVMALMTGCSQPGATASQSEEAAGTSKETAQAEAVETDAPETVSQDQESGAGAKGRVTDGNGWYLWDENGKLTLEGRDASGSAAVVSAGKYEAARAGMEILKAGGNAVDAAAAISFALGVAEPNASGIGGGGFMTIHSAGGENVFVNFRETAPKAADPKMWELDAQGHVAGNEKAIGGKSVGVPGAVKGMEYAFENFGSGKVTWEEVLAPSIALAEEGFSITPTLYSDMLNTYDAMLNYPEFGQVYLNELDLNYQVGENFKNPDLAKTLRIIAEEGGQAFYNGPIAQAMVDSVKKYNGVMTLEDLAE